MKLAKRDFLLLGVIIYFTFIGGTFYSQINAFLRILNQVIVTGLLGGWLLVKLRRREGLPATSLDWALLLYLIVNFVSAFLGQSPRYSLEVLWYSVGHVLAFYLLVDLLRRGWQLKLVWAFYMASAVVCLVGLVEYLAWYAGTPFFSKFALGWLDVGGWRNPIPPYLYRLSITLNGSTPLAAYLALFIPPALAMILTLPRKNENRQALIIWLVMAMTVQALTFSRAGILALLISIPLTVTGWYRVSSQHLVDFAWLRQQLKPGHLLGIFAGGIVVLSGLSIWLYRSFANRAHSTSFRFTLWGGAVDIFQDNPLFGVGPANFGRALLRFNEASLPRAQIATAHNVYLNTAAELGLFGLFAGAILCGGVAWAWIQRWQQQPDPAGRVRLVGVGAALIGFAAQTLFDTYTATPNILPLAALVAYLVKPLTPTAPARWRRMAAPAALAVLALYGIGFVRLAQADLYAQRSFTAESKGDLTTAIAHAKEAQRLDPTLTARTFRLALLQARQPGWGDAAVDLYRDGLRQEPIFGLNSANLAGVLWQQGARPEAIEVLEQTVLADPQPLYFINLGYFFEQQGDWAAATEAYAQALVRSPQLAGSGFWQADPDRADRWPNFVEAAVTAREASRPLDRKLLRVNLALARRDFARIESLLQPETSPLPPQLRQPLAELFLNRQQPEKALAVLDREPRNGSEYRLAGRAKLQQGEEAAAESLLKLAVFFGDREANYFLGRLYEQQGDTQAAMAAYQRGFSPHATAENVSMAIYGRFTSNELAPQMTRMGVSQHQARSWLALASLYETRQRFEEARQIYQILLAEDPFLDVAQERLDLLVEKLPAGS